MKHKSILSIFIFLLGLSVTTTSCEDMLTPDMNRYNEGFSGRDTVNFYFGIIANVQDMVEQNQLLNDLRSDLATVSTYSSDTISDIINYNRQPNGENGLLNRAAYYKVINQCNFYLSRVDTLAQKNDMQYMKKEFAQVVNIRAWVYMQLVQTYGRVPFISKPVNDSNTGWETNPEAWATADNLVDLLKKDLEAANRIEHDTKYGGYPAYGQLDTKTGFTVNTSYLLFYSDLILGDLYLLRGRGVAGESSSDYVKAASYYYHFLKERAQDKGHVVTSTRASITKHEEQGTDIYSYTGNADSWMNLFANTSSLQANENITVIPSSANGQSGHKILSQAAQIYGFDMTSTISGGQVSVGLFGNLRSRQVEPSEAYLQLSAAQNYANVDKYSDTGNDLEWEYYEGAGDARIYATAPTYRVTNGTGNERFIMKDAPKGKFKFYKSVYRLRQVYLRYAEAINRAGYPRLAFAVLRNGLAKKKFPKGLLAEVDVNSIDTENKTFKYIYSLDSCEQNNAINYIGVDELRRMEKDPMYATYLDFGYAASTGDYWTNNGIHEAGCGLSTVEDSLYSYDEAVVNRVADELVRTEGLSASAAVKRARQIVIKEGEGGEDGEGGEGGEGGSGTVIPDLSDYTDITPEPTLPDPMEINAVETMIADELALEMAFEGTRMFDLIRLALHKNNDSFLPADYGTNWLAWKIARRNEPLAPYAEPRVMDGALYNKLLNPENWYIRNPEY